MEARRRMILRRKRTKRSRPYSTVVTSSSSTSGGGGGGGERGPHSDAYFSIPSPQSYENYASTEEDEDIANCLMLLARSGSSFTPKQDHMNDEIYTKKFTSQKFNEMGSSTSGKEEFYSYECKTCNRSFTSFQALGGHRASHKKPKNSIEEKGVLISTISNDKDDQEHIHFNKISPVISQQKAKVHECSICGSEFASGQALGGHMRRHRIPTTNTGTISSIIDHDNQKPRNHVLQLDLNLPAPEDDHYDSKFQFVFSTPALVDCHY
ncbi:zinc finger protein ZAT5-like [Apium graveolens]|uniref:zinc finger protein ZAT5-like n=1 Tax=Apium graveolens TaxID=4045 RepID=UPI003D79D429